MHQVTRGRGGGGETVQVDWLLAFRRFELVWREGTEAEKAGAARHVMI